MREKNSGDVPYRFINQIQRVQSWTVYSALVGYQGWVPGQLIEKCGLIVLKRLFAKYMLYTIY